MTINTLKLVSSNLKKFIIFAFVTIINFFPDNMREYIIFIIGGGSGALVNWVISFILTSLIGVNYVISYSIAQVANITVNFIWHQYITFNVKEKTKEQFLKFFLMSICTAFVSIFMVYLVKTFLLDRLYVVKLGGFDINYLVTIITITLFISVINYFISRKWVFDSLFDS